MNWMKVLAASISILVSCVTFSQSYPDDRDKFVKQFEKLLREYGNGDYQTFAKKTLPTQLLESGDFPDDYFHRMVQTCNLLETKKFKIYPDIYNYVYSVSALIASKQSEASFKAWHSSADKLLDSRNSKKFSDFADMSAGFFSERKIATASNFDWFYTGGSYEFKFDNKAFIEFEGGRLVCRVASNKASDKGMIIDSMAIIDAKGTYDPSLKKWQGESGKITWEKVGLDPQKNFAVFEDYEASLRTSTVRFDTVTLTTSYFEKPITGIMTDRAFKINREEDKVYPQFLSFDRKLIIKEIKPNVDYVGGFQLKGASFIGAGTNAEPASITIKRNNVPFIYSKSQLVIVSEKMIQVPRAETAIYFGTGDSLYHPGVELSYDLEKQNIQFARSRKGIGEAPFQDSYHQLDIFVPKITWVYDSDRMDFTYEFGTGQEQRIASFESKDYFDARLYDELQAMSKLHPLVALSRYAYKYDEPIMSEGSAATALSMTVEQAKATLLKLSNLGFITYDTEAKTVRINDKLETFVAAKAERKDYDNMVFKTDLRPKELKGYTKEQIEKDPYLSSVQERYDELNEKRRLMKNYATMDLTTMALSLNAVDNVPISANKNVVIFPGSNEITLKQNRDFNFSGWVNVGKMEINTVASEFHYDEFKIKILQSTDAIIRARPLRKEDGMRPIPMVSSISGITGDVIIDDVENKSGTKPGFEYYPILKSTTETKIFYNSKDIFRGVYDSTRFYYTLDPFELDSMNSFNEAALQFEGELTSAGIFPVIREPVKIMPDYSFGFSTKAPPGGYPFYGSEAKYENKILLSHNGLQGAGTINFIHSTSISKGLNFLPDSTIGYANFENKAHETAVEFPPVKAEQAYITYVPQDNKLKVASLPKKPLDFFDGEATMTGIAIIQPTGMTGDGFMDLGRGTLVSDGFSYKRWDVDADTADFNLANTNEDVTEDPFALKTDNVSAHVSFKERKGEFNSNQGESPVVFPVIQYMCKMDKFTWFMDEYSIEMERQQDQDVAINTGVDLKGPNFFSLHPKQDSLQFRAPKAKFSVKEKTIYCDEVEYVDIADARIYPDSMKLNIRKKAKIDELHNATVVANYITKYHKFEDAIVSINARRDYKASGMYAYYDADSTKFNILMNNIGLDTSYQTVASGDIAERQNFKLSPRFDYYGKAIVKASDPTITFDGATRINHDCNKFDRNWMSFTAQLDPKNIQIPVAKEMKDLDGNPISAGIVWRNSRARDSVELYPTFLSALDSKEDPIVITASGYLQYKEDAKEFQIGSKEKLLSIKEPGNYIALHTESCSMNGMGNISLGMEFGEAPVDAVGVVNYNQATEETTMNITARFNLKLDEGIFKDVAKRIDAIEGLKPMDFRSTTLESAVTEWQDSKTAESFNSGYTIENKRKIPKSLEKSIVVTGIRLKSLANGQDRGLISTTESAVLVNIYDEPVMKYVPFKIAFLQYFTEVGGDEYSMYLNIPGGRDYFMHYGMIKKDGKLSIRTGDTELSAAISALKEDKLKSKNFKYELTTNSAYVTTFLGLFAEQ